MSALTPDPDEITEAADDRGGTISNDDIRQRRSSAARLAGVQGLYEIELGGATVDDLVIDHLRERWVGALDGEGQLDPDPALFKLLINGVSQHKSALDDMIGGCLDKERGIDRLDAVLRAILRAGVYELHHRPETPAQVVINEYVELANAFYTGNEPGLVNGILDKLGHLLRAGEMGGNKGATAPK
ncbi:MAG: transcription antitermination factor NusB [Proteobacteria bacterium]|nr:transcription antitermination factor NusB [Pseudomonadota bacterium]